MNETTKPKPTKPRVSVNGKEFEPISSAWAEPDGEKFLGVKTDLGKQITKVAKETLSEADFLLVEALLTHSAYRTPEQKELLRLRGFT